MDERELQAGPFWEAIKEWNDNVARLREKVGPIPDGCFVADAKFVELFKKELAKPPAQPG